MPIEVTGPAGGVSPVRPPGDQQQVGPPLEATGPGRLPSVAYVTQIDAQAGAHAVAGANQVVREAVPSGAPEYLPPGVVI